MDALAADVLAVLVPAVDVPAGTVIVAGALAVLRPVLLKLCREEAFFVFGSREPTRFDTG